MEEFLRQNYFLLTHSVEFLAAVIGLFCLQKYKSPAVNFFVYFLGYCFIIDLSGTYPSFFRNINIFYIIEHTPLRSNYWFYTIFWGIGSSVIISLIFNRILLLSIHKKILRFSVILFLFSCLISILLNGKEIFENYIFFIFLLGSFQVLFCVSLYLLEMLRSDKILSFYKNLYFYISTVFLIWYLITTPLIFYEKYFSSADWNFVFLKWQIYLFANIFMYLTFAFALIYCKPEHETID